MRWPPRNAGFQIRCVAQLTQVPLPAFLLAHVDQAVDSLLAESLTHRIKQLDGRLEESGWRHHKKTACNHMAGGFFPNEWNEGTPTIRPEFPRHDTSMLLSQLRFATNGETCARTGDQTRRTSMLPTPSMAPCMTSPRSTAPTPAGVPVKMMSPGCNSNRPDR